MLANITPATSLDARIQRVTRAAGELAAGRPVVMLGSAGRVSDGNLVFAAALASPATVSFAVAHTSGFVCVALPARECDRLGLPPMFSRCQSGTGSTHTVTVDALAGISTGISARDRAHTISLLGSAHCKPGDLTRPGHVVPCSVSDTARRGSASCAEAALTVVEAGGLRPAAAFCALVSRTDPRRMAGCAELREFAEQHRLAMTSVDDVAVYLEETGAAEPFRTDTGTHVRASSGGEHRRPSGTLGPVRSVVTTMRWLMVSRIWHG